jgi:hypothetical protein
MGVLLGQPAPLAAVPPDAAANVTGVSMARVARQSGAGTRIMAGVIDDIDNNAEVRGEKWYGSPGKLGIAGKMLRDPHVRQSIEYIAGPLCAATWRFKPAGKTELDREVADFCTWAFFEQLTWDQVLRRVVQRYSAYGFDLSEVTDDYRDLPATRFPNHPGGGRGIVPTGFHEIPASSVNRWHQSKVNGAQISGIRQYLQGSDAEAAGYRDIDGDRVLRFTWDQEGANFQGFAVLRSAYAPWKLKMAFQELDAIKHERMAVGTPTMTLGEDADDEDIAAAEIILEEMRANEKGFVVLPNGYKFEWTGAGDSSVTNIGLAIERCNKDIAINVSAGYMLLGLTGQSGSYALGATQQTQHHLTVESHAKFVSAGLSVGMDGWSPVERLVRLNYGPGVAVPRAEARNLPTRNWVDIVKAINNSVQVGSITVDDPLEDEVRDMLQVCPRDPATARQKPAPVVPFGKPPGDDTEDAEQAEEVEAA